VHLVGFIMKKFVTMHGHMNVKKSEEKEGTNKDGLHQPSVKLHMRVRRHCNIFIENCVNSKDSYSLFGSISLQNRALQSYNLVAFFRCGMEKPFAVVFVPLLRK
jgi:hypothetical protein